jgi:hypothetical protein
MATRNLTYAELAEIWGVSRDAARKKVEGLRLPRKLGNDGKTRVTIDLEEVSHARKVSRPETGGRPPGDLPETDPGGRAEAGRSPPPEAPEVVALRARLVDLEARAAELRADLEREREETARERGERLQERERAERLSGEVAALARDLARSVEAGADRERALQAELAALRSRSWWRRLVG